MLHDPRAVSLSRCVGHFSRTFRRLPVLESEAGPLARAPHCRTHFLFCDSTPALPFLQSAVHSLTLTRNKELEWHCHEMQLCCLASKHSEKVGKKGASDSAFQRGIPEEQPQHLATGIRRCLRWPLIRLRSSRARETHGTRAQATNNRDTQEGGR